MLMSIFLDFILREKSSDTPVSQNFSAKFRLLTLDSLLWTPNFVLLTAKLWTNHFSATI